MLHQAIEHRLHEAVTALLPGADTAAIRVRPCPEARFGDYQTNALMALARERKLNPRTFATEVAARFRADGLCARVEVAGPGFLNFHLLPAAMEAVLRKAARGGPLFFQPAARPRTVVVDFSSPNVAKPMHVGHIRSTLLGDCLARTLRLLGHRVITDNHIGDWGTQFGKLIVGWKQRLDPAALDASPLEELERLYREINFGCETPAAELAAIGSQLRAVRAGGAAATRWNELAALDDEAFLARLGGEAAKRLEDPTDRAVAWLLKGGVLRRDRLRADPAGHLDHLAGLAAFAAEARPSLIDQARQELLKLQSGDPENLAIWKRMIELSQHQFDSVYARLGVRFDHTLGESHYNPRLTAVVEDLVTRGIARESDGAIVVFFDDDPELSKHPAIVRKSDGAANYATTDLATLEYRLGTWRPDEVIYVTDGRQQLHFKQIFAAFRRWRPEAAAVTLAHVWFGSILGEDGRPFKTRSGDTIRLSELLDEAEERALQVVNGKSPDLPEDARRDIARLVGLAAVKYQDLLPNRQSDYVFSWDKMLALNGNTAPYLQYACTRIRSIFRRLGDTGTAWDAAAAAEVLRLEAPAELALARHLLNLGLTLEAVAAEYRPNYLCNYLYELAGLFTTFYEQCPVLKAGEPVRSSRLVLCDLAARTLATGLDALGIETPDRM